MVRYVSGLMLAMALATSCNTKPAEEAKGGAAPTSAATAERYACPMHPEVTDSKPSDCPKCGMKLVAVKAEDGGANP